MKTSKECEVGYCKPPEHSKWKKGQCGNPKRIRKRPAKRIAELVDDFLASEVEVVDRTYRSVAPLLRSSCCNSAISP
jgi:hypothetical protein